MKRRTTTIIAATATLAAAGLIAAAAAVAVPLVTAHADSDQALTKTTAAVNAHATKLLADAPAMYLSDPRLYTAAFTSHATQWKSDETAEYRTLSSTALTSSLPVRRIQATVLFAQDHDGWVQLNAFGAAYTRLALAKAYTAACRPGAEPAADVDAAFRVAYGDDTGQLAGIAEKVAAGYCH